MKEGASHTLARCPKLGISALEKEVADLYVSFCEEDNQQKARDVPERPKPFAAFGSFKQRHGEVLRCDYKRTIEAPAKLESGACAPRGGVSQAFSLEGNVCLDRSMVSMDGDPLATTQTLKPPQSHLKLHHKGKSFSTDLDREEAWERKKEQYLLEKEDGDSDHDEEYEGLCDELCERAAADENSCGSDDDGILNEDGKVDDRHLSVHGEGNLDGVHLDVAAPADVEHLHALHEDDIKKPNKRISVSRKKSCMRRPFKPLIRTRTRSLTDEDMEELRGSIDLGFGFSYSDHCNLKSTLPALELYYAINKNYDDARTRSSPVSPLDGNALIRTNSAGSASSPSSETWRISSPGDHPSQVKTRLRHWAQAVACSVKQGY